MKENVAIIVLTVCLGFLLWQIFLTERSKLRSDEDIILAGDYAPCRICETAFAARVADHRSRTIWKHARHRREVADIAVDHAEQRADGFLVSGD
jgi:hypothetical protein